MSFNIYHKIINSRLIFGCFIVIFLILVFYFFDGHDIFRSINDFLSLEEATYRVEEGGVGRRISLICLFIFGLMIFLKSPKRNYLINGRLGWFILFFLYWATISTIWANDIILTSRRLIVLVMFWAIALAVAERVVARDLNILVYYISLIFLLMGICSEIILETFQPLENSYRFSGTIHPNHQGINCCLLIISSICLIDKKKSNQYPFIITAFIGFIFLILTKSRTSFISFVIAIIFYGNIALSNSRKFAILLIVSFLLSINLLFFHEIIFRYLENILMFGREEDIESILTLTGRISIWKECLDYISNRPIQGYGYGSFWTPEILYKFSMVQGWDVAEAHSGYLEIALGLGVIGVFSYVIILIYGILRSFMLYKETSDKGYVFFTLILIFSFYEGIAESATVTPSFLYFVNIVILSILGFRRTPNSIN
jgi:exopolysaccharide production protein ExoQ